MSRCIDEVALSGKVKKRPAVFLLLWPLKLFPERTTTMEKWPFLSCPLGAPRERSVRAEHSLRFLPDKQLAMKPQLLSSPAVFRRGLSRALAPCRNYL